MSIITYKDDIISVRPPVKWAGGKSQLISQFSLLFPKKISCLIEPFFGGGAVFFHLRPSQAVISDNNEELVNFYHVVRDKLDLLLQDLRQHENTAEYYYKIRAVDPNTLTGVQRASRFLYLNKTAYNGLWRVNRKGQYNVPFGKYKNPKIIDKANLYKVSAVLQKAEIMYEDFSFVTNVAEAGMFVYMDPPYHPLSKTSNFTSYTVNSFSEEDQRRLAGVFRELDLKDCNVMLSNSDTSLIRELYSGYNITEVKARRAINCRAEGRGPITELVIRNYN